MTETPSKVAADIDLEAAGKRFGSIIVPHSRDDSAWGSVRLPLIVIKGDAPGPTVLFTGGNHGDEYEGPIALLDLARNLNPSDVKGRVIIVPALNLPAVRAGTRTSPIDGGNMNRAFPGRWDGNVTEMIADFVTRFLVAPADAVIDIHSGGKTLDFVPSTVIHRLADADQMARTQAAMMAFGTPLGLILEELNAVGMLDTTVEEMGKIFVSTELGGGGTARPENVERAQRGVRNLLGHFGLVDGALELRETPTRVMETPDAACFTAARTDGLYEAVAPLGTMVSAGDAVGRIHYVEEPERPPEVYRAKVSGMLICRHHPGLAQAGDCLAVVAVDTED